MTPEEFVETARIALRIHHCDDGQVVQVKQRGRTEVVDRTDAWNALAAVVEIRRALREVTP